MKANHGKIDDVLEKLGNPGAYQVFLYILLCFNYFPVCMNHLVMTFYGFKPDFHKCYLKNSTYYVGKCPGTIDLNSSRQNATCQDSGWNYEWDDQRESSIVSEWDLVCGKKRLSSLASSIYFAGVMVGGVIFGSISDKIGRKPVMLFCLYSHVVVGASIYFAHEYILFVVLRFTQGILLQGLQAITFVMVIEMFIPKHRTYVGVVIECFWGMAVMWLALVAWLCRDWRLIQLVITLPSVITLSYIWLVPESLRWLLANHKYSHAKMVVKTLAARNNANIHRDMYQNIGNVESVSESKKLEKSNVLDMVRTKKLRKYSLVMFYVWFAGALVYYGLTLNTSKLVGSRYLNFFLSGLVELPAYIASIYVLTRFGRRKPLCGYFMMSGIFCIISVVLPQKIGDVDMSAMKTASALVGKFAVAGVMSVIFLYASEVFPTVIRNVAFGACAFWLRLGALLAPQINSLDDDTDTGIPAIVFGCAALAGGGMAFFLPETLNKHLHDTVEELGSNRMLSERLNPDKTEEHCLENGVL